MAGNEPTAVSMKPADHAAVEDVRRADELGRPARDGREVDLLRRALLDDRAVAHERDAVGERERLLAVVRDEEHGHAERADDLRDLGAQRLAQEGVDVRPRLVEQHELGRGRERTRERDALLLSAGELVRVAAAEAVEADDPEELRDAGRRAGGAGGRSRRSPRR